MLQVDTWLTVHCGQSSDRPGGRDGATGGTGPAVDRNWRDRAACRSEDPELFFPVGDDGPAAVQVAEAKAVCARCPVVAECLSFALVALSEGMAGGLTVEERRGLRSQPISAPGSSRSPGGVDGRVVASLMAGERVSGASRLELAHAAVGLHLAGHGARWIGTRLGVGDRQVHRWQARHRSGQLMVAHAGRRRAGAAVAS